MANKLYQDSEHLHEPVMTYGHTKTSRVENMTMSMGLNPAQLHFLQILSYVKTDEILMDLKRLVRDHYAQQLQEEADKYWAEGKIGDHLLNEHLRTPYK